MKNHALLSSGLSIVALAFAFCAAGTAQAAPCAPPALANSLAMEQVPDSDLMTVTATVDGSPQKLLVGIADVTQLWNRQASLLKLPVREGRRMMDGGGRFSDSVAQIASLELGSMRTGYFDTQISPDPDAANSGTDGILGTDMMMRYDIDLDFAHRRLNYFSPEQCPGAGVYWAPAKVTSVRMTTYADVVYVPVTLDGHTIVAALDTTADKTFLNPEVADRLFGLTPASPKAGTLTDSGALMQAGMHEFSSLSFAGLTFHDPEIGIPFDKLSQNTREFHANPILLNRYRLSQLLPDLVIGMDVLSKTHLYISFENQRIYVSPAGDGEALNPPALKTSWFNVWRYGYDTYIHPYRRPFFAL